MNARNSSSVAWLLALTLILTLVACSRQSDAPATQTGPDSIPHPTQVAGVIKLTLSRTDIYRVDGSDLEVAGFDVNALQTRKVSLRTGGRPVPIWIDPTASFFCFYGQAPGDRYQAVSTYVFSWGDDEGEFMAEETLHSSGSGEASSVLATERFEENQIYLSRAVKSVGEPWFWRRITPGEAVEVEFSLPDIDSGEAKTDLAFWGATTNREINPDHRVQVVLNGEYLATVDWDGEEAVAATAAIPDGLLRNGVNRFTLSAPADTGNLVDISYLDWIEIEYPIPGELEESSLTFLHTGEGLGVTGADLLFDVTDPEKPIRLVPAEANDGQARDDSIGGVHRRLVALGATGGEMPEIVGPLRDSNWTSTAHQADYVIIAPDALTPALEELAAARRDQGLSVLVVPLEEIGDEFGFGAITPEAINTFLVTVRERWQEPALRYVLLVGEATYDYRNYRGLNPEHVVPTSLVSIEHGGETVSDIRMADLDDDSLPDLAIGRWPVATPAQVEALIARTLAYEAGVETNSRALFVIDDAQTRFTRLTDALIQAAGSPGEVVRLLGVSGEEMVNAWRDGAWLVYYTGHGSLDLWGKTEIMSSTLADQLVTRGKPPIVVQLTCLTGLFAHPSKSSLSEVMLWSDSGPVAVVAATSLTLPVEQQPFGVALIEALSDPSVETIGEALLIAQRSPNLNHKGGQEIVDTFHLLGDPALVISRPVTAQVPGT